MTRRRGFSLIEMAFVLVIVTLLLGGLLVPFATQVEQRRITETQKGMEEIKEALVGYALSHSSTSTPSQPYLPCPDATATPVPGGGTANDGLEDRNGTGCAVPEGNLPWVDLGVNQVDAWGNRFHYRVMLGFADSSGGFGLSAPTGDITVCSTFTGCPASNKLADKLPAVVLSYGKNGLSFSCAPIPPNRDNECENRDNDINFVSTIITGPGAVAGEFDDLVAWVSPNILFNRMVAAGRLP